MKVIGSCKTVVWSHHQSDWPVLSKVAGCVQDGWKEGQYWDTAKPFHYVRAVKDDKGLVLLVGGEDHNTGIKPKDYEVCPSCTL